MPSATELVQALTDPKLSINDKRRNAASFSRQFGWRPNDVFDMPNALPTVNLVVEHGLENAAMLSFLPANRKLEAIRPEERRDILGLSYNSLVDWHVWIDRDSVQCFYNRVTDPAPTYAQGFDHSDHAALTRRIFDEAIGKVPKPDFLTLDGALFDTITTWREILHRELNVNTATISALFNSIILARAVEDFHHRVGTLSTQESLRDKLTTGAKTISQAVQHLLLDLTGKPVPHMLFNRTALERFDSLPFDSRLALVDAFYRHRAVPYEYDFSVVSKYALSKIYERYVALMRDDAPFQIAMLPSTRDEGWNKELGGIYTPQFIASFFAKYLSNRMSGERFMNLSVADPACGSGIFLRAAMEQKLLSSNMDPEMAAGPAFQSLFGVDIDENAVAASRLSLALLHLAAKGELPDEVPIIQGDSMECFAVPMESYDRYDAVMVNPPFIRTELQSQTVRAAIRKHANVGAKGKLDMYLAFLVFSIRALKPGGIGCFVVPQSLLTSDNLKGLRDWILEQAWVHVVADLSAIRVFEAGVYVALIIVEKKNDRQLMPPRVSVIRCQRDVGAALDDFLDSNYVRTFSHAIFRSGQDSLDRPTWSVPFPEESQLLGKLESMRRLNEFAVVQQGVITGADDVFILNVDSVPPGEEEIYVPHMPETMIGHYALPDETGKRMLYPYIDGVPVGTEQMKGKFPATWDWLNKHRAKLSKRASAPLDPSEWWRPAWPRVPDDMLSPKVILPRFVLLPRFGIDVSGKWIVKQGPIIRPRYGELDHTQLFLLAAILNSSVAAWYMDLNGRKLGQGYNEIGVSLLRRFPIPDLGQVSSIVIRRISDSVNALMNSYLDFDYENASRLDDIVLRDIYRLDMEDLDILKPST